jgi:hypothetical protein
MTTPTDLTDRVHAAQLAAVTKSQDLTVATVRRLADLRERAPKAPTRVVRLVQPLTDRWQGYRSDWVEAGRSFQERLSDAARNGSKATEAPVRPTVVKATAAKKRAAKS